MVLKQQHIWHRSSHWKPQWFCGCPQGMVLWINVVDNPGPPWRKTMRLGWSCHLHPGMPPQKNWPFFRTGMMFRGVCFSASELDFLYVASVNFVFGGSSSCSFVLRNKCKNQPMPRSMPWTSTRSPKKLCCLTSCPLNFCGFAWMRCQTHSHKWHFTYMSPMFFWVPDLRTWLSLLVTLIVAAIKIQSKNFPRPWDFQSQQLFGEAFCRHVGQWVM